MSYRIRRIDPYWITNPIVITAVVAGILMMLVGYTRNMWILSLVGVVVAGVGILLATKKIVSAVLGSLGFLGGVVTFVLVENPQMADASIFWKFVSAFFFALLYMVLMDAVVLTVAAFYNLYGNTLNMGGIQLEFEEGGEDEGPAGA